ncbi:MAG: zinc ribbon domain-containing protein [Clostridia bacterium]|nr:zinc ribbon domain-containing protein [Clostridia bacterium]
MSNCPNCGKKLKIINVGQFCPHCGANMRFINFEENFYREAKYAELAQANVKAKIKRFKGAFIGSKLTIVRLVAALLPLLTLLIPNGGYSIRLPLLDISRDFGVMGLVSIFTGSDLGYIMGMTGSGVVGADFSALQTALFGYVGAAVAAVLVFLLTVLCFLSIKNMQKIISAFAALGVVLCGVGFALILSFAGKCADTAMIGGRSGFGLLITVVAFIAVIAVNLILDKKGVPVDYEEGMVERAAIYKKLRRGEVKLEDLPQPVVETEKTRALEAKIAEEEAKYRKEIEEEAENDG